MMPYCKYPECTSIAVSVCDNGIDQTPFCSDHGSPGGDIQIQDVGAVAIASLCWKCGGFNYDA